MLDRETSGIACVQPYSSLDDDDRVRVAHPLSSLDLDLEKDRVSEADGVVARNKSLLNQAWLSDASLCVGPDERKLLIPIHSAIVAPASPFLAAALDGRWRRDGEAVRFKDFESTVVLSALRFIYCDELVVLEQDLEDLLHFACLYLMKPLVNALVQRVFLSNDCFWKLLSVAVQLDWQLLLSKCHELLFADSRRLLSSSAFLAQPVEVVAAVTRMDPLDVTECELFLHCYWWSEAECRRQQLEPTPGNHRSLMQPFLQNIAMGNVSYSFYTDCVRKAVIINPSEFCDVMSKMYGRPYGRSRHPQFFASKLRSTRKAWQERRQALSLFSLIDCSLFRELVCQARHLDPPSLMHRVQRLRASDCKSLARGTQDAQAACAETGTERVHE